MIFLGCVAASAGHGQRPTSAALYRATDITETDQDLLTGRRVHKSNRERAGVCRGDEVDQDIDRRRRLEFAGQLCSARNRHNGARVVDQLELRRVIEQHVVRQIGDDRRHLHVDRTRRDQTGNIVSAGDLCVVETADRRRVLDRHHTKICCYVLADHVCRRSGGTRRGGDQWIAATQHVDGEHGTRRAPKDQGGRGSDAHPPPAQLRRTNDDRSHRSAVPLVFRRGAAPAVEWLSETSTSVSTATRTRPFIDFRPLSHRPVQSRCPHAA